MFYLEYLIKKYGQVKKEEAKPRDSVISVKFKPGMRPKPKPLQETIDTATGKPARSTYALGGLKARKPVEVRAVEKVKEKVWDIPAEFWKKKLSENELSEVNSVIDKVSQDIGSPQLKGRVEEMMAGKAVANVIEGKAKAMHPLAAQGLKKNPQLRKTYLRSVGEEPSLKSKRAPAPRKPTTKEIFVDIPKTHWKGKLSEDRMSFLDSAIDKIAKKRYSEAAKERMGVRAPGTPKKVEETYEAIKESPKAREWIRKHPYKGRSPKARAASIAWAGHKKSKKAEFSVPEILEKIGADPDLVSTAKVLESLSEEMGRKTMLDFWARLGRAALSAKIMATPEVRGEMMKERGLAGAAIGAPLAGLAGYGLGGGRGAIIGAGVGAVGGATLGSLLAYRKSKAAERLLEDPLAQRALVTELAKAIEEKRPAQLI